MNRFAVYFVLISLLFSSAGAEIGKKIKTHPNTRPDRIYLPGSEIQESPSIRPAKEIPHRDERVLAGDTWYDYQSNGTVGKMIALDSDGGIHITWMDGENDNMVGGPRHQKYNVLDENGNWLEEDGLQIDEGDRGGYGCIWLSNEDPQRAMPFYHVVLNDVVTGMCGMDWQARLGAFINTPLPRYPENEVIWPQGVMSPEGRIHTVANRRDARMISYSGGDLDFDGNPRFPNRNAEEVGETHLNTFRIARSPVSERVAITWMTSRVGIPVPDAWANHVAYQINNDLMLAWTDDGEEWNFDEPLNITDNLPPDPHREGNAAYGDTLRPFCTHDVIFDSEDNIHVIFDARGLWVQPIPVDQPPVDGWTVDASCLFHWSEDADEITPVADGWYSHREEDEDGNITRWPTPGAWRNNVCNPSMGYDAEGDLYCVFNYYPTMDYSTESYCNGDVAVTVSEDNGRTWYMPTMITETRSHEADPGESLCESYPTLAEVVDDQLHISYEMDTEPGTTIQDYPGRNEMASLCPWYYHSFDVDDVLREDIWEDGPNWHATFNLIIEDVGRQRGVPVPDEDVIITAHIVATGGNDLAGAYLDYRIGGNDGEIVTVEMRGDEDDIFSEAIPAQDENTTVWYRLHAIDEGDNETYVPTGYWYSYVVRPEGGLRIHDVQYRFEEWVVDYSPYRDYEVTLTGVVTTPLDFNDLYGAFAIQEASAFWSGVFVRGYGQQVEMGTLVRVTGTVRERDPDDAQKWKYQTYIEINADEDVEVLGEEELPDPLVVDINELTYETHAEHLEGVLVRLENWEIGSRNNNLRDVYLPLNDENGNPAGWLTTYGLDEGVIIDLDIDTWVQGTAGAWVQGVFAENQHYAIAPRGDSDFSALSVKGEMTPSPVEFRLRAVYPNPFNNRTRVMFEIPAAGFTHIAVYDLAGRLVTTALEGSVPAGNHAVTINANDMSTGVYILRLKTDYASESRKIVLIQ